MKFGEIVGLAVRSATIEALRWQNGLEASYTRSVFHALGRYGVTEGWLLEHLMSLLPPESAQLLQRNSRSVFFDPMVGAAAHATAAVMDRVRHQTLPASVVPDVLVREAATLAVAVAAQPDRWTEFRSVLHAQGATDVRNLVSQAIALGWQAKWEH